MSTIFLKRKGEHNPYAMFATLLHIKITIDVIMLVMNVISLLIIMPSKVIGTFESVMVPWNCI